MSCLPSLSLLKRALRPSPRGPAWKAAAGLALWIFLGAQGARAVSVAFYKAADNSLAPKLDFDLSLPPGSYAPGNQYLAVVNDAGFKRRVKIYTNNASWTGNAQSDRAGMVSALTNQDVLPIFWTSAGSQPQGRVDFSSAAAISWRRMADSNNPGFSARKDSDIVEVAPFATIYIVFWTQVPSNAPDGRYQTHLSVEVSDDGPAGAAPTLTYAPCDSALMASPLVFKAKVEDQAPLQSAAFNYRYQGDPDFIALPMGLFQSPGNPLQWSAQAVLPGDRIKAGILEYYFQASDSSSSALAGSAQAPFHTQLTSNPSPLNISVSPAGMKPGAAAASCGASAQSPQLAFLPGSVDSTMQISVIPLASQSLPAWKGLAPTSAYEFSPSGARFNRPVTLTLAYSDDDNDGIVDGTSEKAQDLRVFWYDGTEWRNLGGTVNQLDHTVSATVAHFSTFALFASGDPSPEDIRPKERIITPNGDGINDFAQFGVSGHFKISLFNVQGKRVRKLEDMNVWDGRDDGGRIVESGAYVYQVKTDRGLVSGTIGVAR